MSLGRKVRRIQRRLMLSSLRAGRTIHLKLWHSTVLDRIRSIMEKGLIPGYKKPAGQSWKGDYHGKGIYFHSTFPEHEIKNGYMGKEVYLGIVEVEMEGETSKLRPDEEAGYPKNRAGGVASYKAGSAVVYLDTIPPSTIRLIHIPHPSGVAKKPLLRDLDLTEYNNLIRWHEV